MFRANGRLSESDQHVLSYEAYCRILESMCCYDQVDCSRLASAELIGRQVQMIEEQLVHKFEDPSSDGHIDYYLMAGAESRQQLCICPELKKYMASEVAQKNSVLKELRNAREERALAHPKAKAKAKSG